MSNRTKSKADGLKELFDDDEVKLMSEFVTEVEKTFKPIDLINSSNTASAISRTIQQVGRALVGIFGFKFANIQGLLAARGAFDRSRDIISQKAAEKLIRKEFSAEFGRNINPYIDNNEEYVGCKFIPSAQKDFDKHKERYIKLILNNKNNDTIQTKKTD